jgi:hypothetical protein
VSAQPADTGRGGTTGSDDRSRPDDVRHRVDDPVEHLVDAARDLIGAARSVLDALEAVLDEQFDARTERRRGGDRDGESVHDPFAAPPARVRRIDVDG